MVDSARMLTRAAAVAILYRDARSDDDGDDDPDGDPDDTSNSDTFYDASDLGQSDEAAASTTAEVGPQTTPVASTPPTMQIVRRRTALPAPMKDRSQVSLWQIIKDFVGKDISKIAVPVYFNEPLSFLQKFSEDLEYHELLSKAANGARVWPRAAVAADLRCRRSARFYSADALRRGVCDLAVLGDAARGQAVQPDSRRNV